MLGRYTVRLQRLLHMHLSEQRFPAAGSYLPSEYRDA